MTFDFNYKRIITVLMIGLILLGGLFWYREQSTNKQVPKRANFVINIFEGEGDIWEMKRYL